MTRGSHIERVKLPLRQAPALAPGQAHFWQTRLANLPVMEAQVPTSRSDRLRQLRMGQKFVLRLLLGAYLGIPGRDVAIVRSAAGKPQLGPGSPDPELQFNLSHAGELMAVAITRAVPVGIDIELGNRPVRWQKLSRRWFSAAESDWLQSLEASMARHEFLRAWTLREAMIKAMGSSIGASIAAIVPEPGQPASLHSLPQGWPDAGDWTLHEIAGDATQGWLAAPARIETVRGFELLLGR
ncbi:MAG: 4'-phosphopantetheinyl transferase superfamily protein [Xanthomonadaceae bacterium]|nr:4'-phosphopantetheinyl transferase superfamily protein [Xanthomonadaceae bacterium]